MIARTTQGRTFGGLVRYAVKEAEPSREAGLSQEAEPGREAGLGRALERELDDAAGGRRVAWTHTRNLFEREPAAIAQEMADAARLSERTEKPVYHLVLGYAIGDDPSPAAMRELAGEVLEDLGLGAHQAYVVAHANSQAPHMHLIVNRVHPDTGQAWNAWRDRYRIRRLLVEQEKERGLYRTPLRREVARALTERERSIEADRAQQAQVERQERRDIERSVRQERAAGRGRPAAAQQGWDPRTAADWEREVERLEGRRAELAAERRGLEREADGLRASIRTERAAVEQVKEADRALGRAFDRLYHDGPAARRAFEAYRAGAAARGEDPGRELATHPERFGRHWRDGLSMQWSKHPEVGGALDRARAATRAMGAGLAQSGLCLRDVRALERSEGSPGGGFGRDPAVEAAGREAAVGRGAIEAAHRLEDQFAKAYREPALALQGVVRAVADVGARQAVGALVRRPETYGRLRRFTGRRRAGRIAREISRRIEKEERSLSRGSVGRRIAEVAGRLPLKEPALASSLASTTAKAEAVQAREQAVERDLGAARAGFSRALVREMDPAGRAALALAREYEHGRRVSAELRSIGDEIERGARRLAALKWEAKPEGHAPTAALGTHPHARKIEGLQDRLDRLEGRLEAGRAYRQKLRPTHAVEENLREAISNLPDARRAQLGRAMRTLGMGRAARIEKAVDRVLSYDWGRRLGPEIGRDGPGLGL
jgi:hypothetical protein